MNITQGNLANLYKQQGRLEAARRLNEQALVGLREVGDRRAAGNVLCNLGNIASAMGDLEMAAQSLTECIEIALDIRNPRLVAVGRGNLGDVLLKQGQLNRLDNILRRPSTFVEQRFQFQPVHLWEAWRWSKPKKVASKSPSKHWMKQNPFWALETSKNRPNCFASGAEYP